MTATVYDNPSTPSLIPLVKRVSKWSQTAKNWSSDDESHQMKNLNSAKNTASEYVAPAATVASCGTYFKSSTPSLRHFWLCASARFVFSTPVWSSLRPQHVSCFASCCLSKVDSERLILIQLQVGDDFVVSIHETSQ